VNTKKTAADIFASVKKRKLPLLLVVIAFIGLGALLIRSSFAATYVVAIEAESGTRSANAGGVSDAAASGGQAVRFTATTTPPTPPAPTPGPVLITQPANPNLSKQGRNVLAYIQSLQGKGIIAGQQETDQCGTCESDRMKSITGKAPGLQGHETADYAMDPMATAIADFNTRRQLVELSWHFGAPPSADNNFENSKGTTDVNRVLQSGTNENRVYMAKLDKMAARLQTLEDANVPVLWRPLHEMNGGWFWWSKSGSGPYKSLWIQMYNYFTVTKGLNNLIWVWSAAENEQPNASWYPGDQYVDILGSDTYGGNSNITNWTNHYNKHKQIASSKPSALTENDKLPNPDELISRGNKMTWFMPWYGQYVDVNSAAFKKQVYNHSYVITADEMPDLR
jgi:Glycosyl hydrolase family 26